MRNGEEGVSYRLVFLSGSTAAKTVNFVNGSASDSTAFSTEGNYTIALVAGNTVLQQYANIRVGNPPAQTYTLSGSITNNPGSSAIIFTVDGNVVTSGSQVEEGKTVHVEITNATENWEAFTVNNMTKVTTLSGTSRVVDFVMPSANASCVASFTTPPTPGDFDNMKLGGQSWSDDEFVEAGQKTVTGTYTGTATGTLIAEIVKKANKPSVGGYDASGNGDTLGAGGAISTSKEMSSGNPYWLIIAKDLGDDQYQTVAVYDYKVTVS